MNRLEASPGSSSSIALLVVLGAQRDGHQRLRFAAREQRRTVRARQHADFDGDLADLVEGAAIGTAAILQHLVAEDPLLQRVVDTSPLRPSALPASASAILLLELAQPGVALELGILLGVHRVGQLGAHLRRDLVEDFLVRAAAA